MFEQLFIAEETLIIFNVIKVLQQLYLDTI